MRLLRDCLLPIALGFALTPAAARADDTKPDGKEEMQTIHGVISDFTEIGEADVDETNGKVTTASATLVTVIGHPHHHHDAAHQGPEAAKANDGDKGSQAQHPRHRLNLYVVALSSKTKIAQVMASGKEVAADDKSAEFDDLEVGDRVELVFAKKDLDKAKKVEAKVGDDQAKGDPKKADQKHGRHRTYFGEAVSIKLLPEAMGGEHSASPEKK